MSLKEKLMNNMMDKQFSNMSTEERTQMMDTMMEKFFSGMAEDDKKEMMQAMMPKMMGNMMGGSGNHPMMNILGMMMGKKADKGEKGEARMPWDNCKDMMTGFTETAHTARFATPELRGLFNEWCEQIEQELMEYIKEKKTVDIEDLAEHFNLTSDSIGYLLERLAKKKLIDYKI